MLSYESAIGPRGTVVQTILGLYILIWLLYRCMWMMHDRINTLKKFDYSADFISHYFRWSWRVWGKQVWRKWQVLEIWTAISTQLCYIVYTLRLQCWSSCWCYCWCYCSYSVTLHCCSGGCHCSSDCPAEEEVSPFACAIQYCCGV